MHNQKVIKETYEEASHLLNLSFTPLGLVGIPRAITGKTMEFWKGLPVMYGFGAVCYYVIAPMINTYSPASASGVHWAGITMLALGAISHICLVLGDMQMFYAIKQRLEGLIEN